MEEHDENETKDVVTGFAGESPISLKSEAQVTVPHNQTATYTRVELTAMKPPSAREFLSAFPHLSQALSVSKQELRLFKTYAARCATSVKSKFDDMRDCHSAAASLVAVLNYRGFADARVIGCSVCAGNRNEIVLRLGEIEVSDSGRHSVVLVKGCLIDATAGQFRCPEIQIPDYLVLPGRIALTMLEINRRWMETKGGEIYMHSVKNGGNDFLIAYIPTDPGFTIKEHGRLQGKKVGLL
jgi:hypothetical protein